MEGNVGEEIKGIAGRQFEPLPQGPQVTGNTSWLIGKTKKLALVGCSDSRGFAPFAFDPNKPEEAWEIWGVNNGYADIPRWTRWFEIHPIRQTPDGKYQRRKELRPGIFEYSDDFRGSSTQDYLKTLAVLDCPVYMQKKWDIIPKSQEYPLQEVLNKFGYYFTNTISYQIALGIMEGFTEMGLYGVDMATGCPDPDVKVLTADLRWIRAGDLQVGDGLMAFDEKSSDGDGKARRWRKTHVTSNRPVMKPCYRLRLEDGTEMIVSAKHGWLTHGENENRWKCQDALITRFHRKDRPSRIVKVLKPWDEDNSWEAGYLAAAFDGEGHISQKPRHHGYTHGLVAGFAQKKNAMSETVEKILNKYGFKCRMNNSDGTNKYRINGGRSEIIRFLGSVRPPRLLAKFDPDVLGQFCSMDNVAVVESEYIGEREVIGLETEAKTFIAEGLASHNSEYGPQRPSCEWMLGIAAGLGIKLTIPPQADLLKSRFLYAFQEREQTAWELKMQNMKNSMLKRLQKSQNAVAIETKKADQYTGALEAVRECERVWANLMTKKDWRDPW